MQFDADTVGSASMAADAEMCMLAADTMEALGIKRGQYVVRVNNRKLLDGAMEALGISSATQKLAVLRSIDKLDRLGVSGVRQLLGPGRKDESGDVTAGAGLTNEQIDKLEILYSVRDEGRRDFFLFMRNHELLDDDLILESSSKSDLGSLVIGNPRFLELYLEKFGENPLFREGAEELQAISRFVRAANYGTKRIRADLSVVRGLEYYTGPVFEVELLIETKDEKGRPIRFGSVGGGGRYDGLVSRFRGETVPATGFSIGVSRLQAALSLIGKLGGSKVQGPVVVTVFDKDRIADYQAMVAQLRAANIRAELYLGNPKNLGNQLKYADKRNAPCVIIQGGDEKAKGEVTIKDLTLGAALAVQEKGRDEYLQKQTQAQRTVPQADLVKEVQAILARRSA
jgi:histidyl-tRNA synthetase